MEKALYIAAVIAVPLAFGLAADWLLERLSRRSRGKRGIPPTTPGTTSDPASKPPADPPHDWVI